LNWLGGHPSRNAKMTDQKNSLFSRYIWTKPKYYENRIIKGSKGLQWGHGGGGKKQSIQRLVN